MQKVLPFLLALIFVVTACSNSDSGTSGQTLGTFTLDDEGESYRMVEGKSYELIPSGGTYEESTVLSWNWSAQPVVSGDLAGCAGVTGFSRTRTAKNLVNACTRRNDCNLTFDQTSVAESDPEGKVRFEVSIPVLKAPVGLKYRLEGSHESGQIVVKSFTFCLIAENTPPIAEDDSFTVTEGVPRIVDGVSGNLLSNDADDIDTSNDGLKVKVPALSPPSLSSDFTLNENGGFTYTYTGDQSVAGGASLTDSFQYEITDGTHTDVATVTLQIVTSDKPPQVSSTPGTQTLELGVNSAIDLAQYFTDPEGGEIFFSLAPGSLLPPSGGITLSEIGILGGTAAIGDAGTYELVIVVSDQVTVIEVPISVVISTNLPPIAGNIGDITLGFGDLLSVEAGNAFSDPEGVALNFSLASQPASDLQINPSSGLISGQISTAAVYAITVTASDGINPGVSTAFTVTQLKRPNRAPVFDTSVASQTVTLGQAITPITVDFSDPDQDLLTYQSTALPAGLTFNETTGVLSGTPAAIGSTSITFTAADPEGLTANSNLLEITVSAVPNQKPLFAGTVPDASGTVGVSLTLTTLTTGFSDPDGDTLTYTLASNSAALPTGLSLFPSGQISGTPTLAQTVAGVIIEGSDGTDTVVSNAFSLTIASGNVAPVAVDDSASTQNSTPVNINVLSNDSDGNSGDILDVIGVTTPSNGTALINADTTVTYTPNATHSGSDSFGYTVSDGNGETDTATVTVVTSALPNRPPSLGNIGNQTVQVGSSISAVTAVATDPDGDSLSYAITPLPLPAGYNFNASNGTLNGSPEAVATINFTLTATDPGGLFDSKSFSITASAIPNSDPVAVNDSASTQNATAVNITVLANDTDANTGDVLSVTSVTTPANGSAVLNANNTVTYTPSATHSGSDTFDYVVNDGSGGTDTGTVTVITSAIPNRAPTIGNIANQSVTVGASISDVEIVANDPDGDSLSYSIVPSPLPSGYSFTVATGTLSGAPDAIGPVSFTATVTDPGGLSDSEVFLITATAVPNSPPVAVNDSATTAHASPVTIDVLSNDTDVNTADVLSVINTTNPANGSVSINPDSTITYTPIPAHSGVDSFNYTVSDGQGGKDTGTVTVVTSGGPPNQPPIMADIPDQTVEVGTPIRAVVPSVNDPENATLIYTITPDPVPAGYAFVSATGTLSGSPAASGVQNFIIVATDPGGLLDSEAFSITATPAPNNTPVAVDDAGSTVGTAPVTVSVLDNDTDADVGDVLTLLSPLASAPATGSASVNITNGTVTYTADATFTGLVTFNYTVADGNGGTDVGTVTITVTAPPNNAPVAVDDVGSTAGTAPVTVSVLDNDTDADVGDVLTLVSPLASLPATGNATLDIANGTITYRAQAQSTSPVIFDYTVTDGNGGSDVGTVTIVITTAANNAPVAVADFGTVVVGLSVTLDVVGNDTDLDPNDVLAVFTVNDGLSGSSVLDPDGRVTYTPNAGFIGQDAFNYVVVDGNGGSDTGSVTITVSSA